MFRTIKSEKFENMEIVAVEYNGLYTIGAYVDGVAVGSYYTRDLNEAQEVYVMNVWEMYA